MADTRSEKDVLADEYRRDVLEGILSDRENLFFVDDVMAHTGSSPQVLFIEWVEDHGAAYPKVRWLEQKRREPCPGI
ncbi:hypothetical protein FHR70_003422 [Microvirga lupini]|uniref:Uncharacterized protein n=1 Tax=Microvirga lupini TaxID=420324 RepID=A0A7W4VNX8_9HYPH|nr:hypothetical protein [Microvirga lupini]